MSFRVFVIVAALEIATGSAALGQPTSGEFLPPAQAARLLIEGQTWSALTSSNREAKVTFNKDGTGRFEGPMTLTTSWEIKGQEICLSISIVGTKCLRFRQTSRGLDGYVGQTLDLRLSR